MIYETVAELWAHIRKMDARELREESPLDSPMDIARFAIACEKAFPIPFYDEEVAKWQRLSDVCAYIQGQLDMGMGEPTEREDEDRTAWFYE